MWYEINDVLSDKELKALLALFPNVVDDEYTYIVEYVNDEELKALKV